MGTSGSGSGADPKMCDLCLVMEHCEAGDLYQYLVQQKAKGPIQEPLILQWIAQIASALNVSHPSLSTFLLGPGSCPVPFAPWLTTFSYITHLQACTPIVGVQKGALHRF